MGKSFIQTFKPMIKHTRGVLTTPCMLFKMDFYTPFLSVLYIFILKVYVSPLPIICPVFVFNKSLDAILIIDTPIKKINKKIDRFFSNTINIHVVHPLFISIHFIYYSVKSLFFKCFYGITGMQVLYIFFLTNTNKYERMYKW